MSTGTSRGAEVGSAGAWLEGGPQAPGLSPLPAVTLGSSAPTPSSAPTSGLQGGP